MTELRDVLTQAFETAPSVPAEPKLSVSIGAAAYWTFAPSLEIVLAQAERLPAEGQAVAAWTKRLSKRPIPLVLIIEAEGQQLVVGPSGKPPPAVRLDARLVVDELAAARELDPLDVRKRLPLVWQRARGAGGMTGLRNVGLFSTHFLRSRTPGLADWSKLGEQGGAARGARSLDARLKALGFDSEELSAGVYLLRAENRPAAAVLSYPPNQDFDRAAAGGELPVAHLLREVEAAGTRWGILVSGDVWRLYSAEHPARTTSFAELDLARLGDPAYFAALFSAAALSPAGLAEAIEKGSRDFAVGLGDRLRGRIYERVVPDIVAAIASELERLDEPPQSRAELEGVYEATLILLYRLLFVLYAESREYLPIDVSAGYEAHSLRRRLDAIVATVEAGRDFDETARDVWSDLEETLGAIARGQREWGVPAYNGGLFYDDPKTRAGSILSRVSPTNAGIGRALYELAVDRDDDDTGRIDYSDLDIRHLGDMYEGLLSFEADRAREDLSYDSSKDAYVPTTGDDPVAVAANGVYLRGRSGGRKASGSYYTPQIVVRHVVEEALVPVHDEHLADVRRLADAGEEEKAARLLWDFRVCDPAMGSGHFLVDALDVLTDRIAAFLAERPLAPVRAVLNQLRETVQAQARDLPAGVLEQIRDVDLLKRVVLKRSIYGVDLNPMAVELAKLALWLDAFVPGLPLSYLDHNLRRGNSLVGVVGDEVLSSLRPERATLEGDWISEQLAAAVAQARLAVESVELRLEDVDAARHAELERHAAISVLERVYDRWTAESFGIRGARARIAQLDTLEAEADARDAERIAAEQSFFHWPLELPEVFQRDRPGFDVVLANPPWEKLMKEKHAIYALYAPGLRGIKNAAERNRLMDLMDAEGSPARSVYTAAVAEYERKRPYFVQQSGNYVLGGGGHIDLFKAFAERFLRLVRRSGRVGAVLPSSILYAPSTKKLRAGFMRKHTLVSADVLENRGQWVFPSVHAEQTFGVYAVAQERADPEKPIVVSPLIRGREEFTRVHDLRIGWSLNDLEDLFDDLEVPLLESASHAALVRRMLEHPALGSEDETWFARPLIEFVVANDWKGGEGILNRDGIGWPVWTGRNFDQYCVRDDEEPAYWINETTAREILQSRRESSYLWRRLGSDIDNPLTLPITSPRIFYRRTTNRNNARTAIFCFAPPHVSGMEDAPVLWFPEGSFLDQAHALGYLNSLPLDWLVRRLVERKLGLKLLARLPVPREAAFGPAIAKNAARLSTVDERWRLLADAAGVEVGPLSAEETAERRAEIDALVARAYGLSVGDLEVIFANFGEAAVPEAYRERVRAHYHAVAVAP